MMFTICSAMPMSMANSRACGCSFVPNTDVQVKPTIVYSLHQAYASSSEAGADASSVVAIGVICLHSQLHADAVRERHPHLYRLADARASRQDVVVRALDRIEHRFAAEAEQP